MEPKSIVKIVASAILGLIILSAIIGSAYVVDEGRSGVVLRNGAFKELVEPGLNFKVPFIDTVKEIDLRTQSRVFPKKSAYSSDQQPADMAFSVAYRIPADKVLELYKKYGSVEAFQAKVIDRAALGQIENVFGQYTAEKAIKGRAALVSTFQKAVEANAGLAVIEAVQIEDIEFSKDYEDNIGKRMKEEVEVTKRQQTLEKERIEKQIKKEQTDAAAYDRERLAQADAAAIKAKGLAEAEAINAKGKALRDNPALVELTYAERWNGITPTTVVPNSSITGLNISK